MNRVTVRLRDKETGRESKPVDIEDIIFRQSEVEFEFGEYEDDEFGTLPYKDFIFFQGDYEVIVHIKGEV